MSNSLSSDGGTSHIERTAAEPRDESLHEVILGDITQVNDRIRTFRLNIPRRSPPIKFLAGQWLDVHIPNIPKPGGFTITSSPLNAQPMYHRTPSYPTQEKDVIPTGYLELAVQKSPANPAAAWLWRPAPEILGQELHVRVGGNFVWPPPLPSPVLSLSSNNEDRVSVDREAVRRVVFVAGGVGINPFMSMIAQIGQEGGKHLHVSVLYTVRDPGEQGLASVLYLERLAKLFKAGLVKGELVLHLTTGEKGRRCGDDGSIELAGWRIQCRRRRIAEDDLLNALGSADERRSTTVYICGVALMTDELVEVARQARGMDWSRVLFEKWW